MRKLYEVEFFFKKLHFAAMYLQSSQKFEDKNIPSPG